MWHGTVGSGWAQRGLDPRHLAEVLPIAGWDGDRPLVDERQVPLGDVEHVEVVPKARAGMELAECRGDPLGHAGDPETLVRHRPGVEPLEREDIPLRQRRDDPWCDAGRRRRDSVVDLVPAVDGEQLRVRAGIRTKNGVPSTTTRQFVFVSPAGMRSAVTARPTQSGIAATTCSIEGMVTAVSGEQLSLHGLGQPRLEAVLRPAASIDEEMEQPGIDEDPQDVRRSFLVESVAERGALGKKVADDVPRADAAFRHDRLEDVADFRICARGPEVLIVRARTYTGEG